jgi:hypothetical protein
MRAILRSPRKRRRLAYGIGIPLGIAVLVIGGAMALPKAKKEPREVFSNKQAYNVAAHEKAVPLTRADRRRVNKTIDMLMNAGVKREDPDAVYAFATPQLRSQATRAQWRRGDIPVYPYPALGKKFHGWTINYSQKNHLNVDLMVMPSKNRSTLGPVALTLDLREIHDKWLIDGLFPVATFAPLPPQGNRGPVISTYDLVPAAAGSAPNGARTRLSYAYFALPAVIIVGGIVSIVGFFVLRAMRDRRAQRRYAAQRPLRTE